VFSQGRDLAGVTYRSGGHAVSHRFSSGVGKGVRRTELHGSLRSRSEELGVVFVEASVGSVTEPKVVWLHRAQMVIASKVGT